MSTLAQLFDITNSSQRNSSPLAETVLDIDQEAIDEIKNDFKLSNYVLPFPATSTDDQLLYHQQMLYFYIRDLNVRELTPFYDDNIKTGYIQTLVEAVIDGIFDGTIYESLGDKHFKPEDAEDLIFNLLVHGRVLVTKKLDKFNVIPPFRYFKTENGVYHVYHYTLDNQPLKEEYLDNMCTAYRGETLYKIDKPLEAEYFELECRPIVTDGMLELAMLRSLLYTLLQSDLWGGSTINFIDEQYLDENGKLNRSRVNYVPTQTVENQNPDGAGIKPLFETVTPQIRSAEYQSLLDVIDDTTATLVGMTSEIIGSQNATESQALSAKTAKRFNKLKVIIQYQLNAMYKHFGLSKKIDLSRYRSDSDEIVIRNAVLVAGSNIGTVRPFLEKLYPDLSEEELDIMYLKGEIKAGRPLTGDEAELAKELNLEPIEQTKPREGGTTRVSDPMTTDSEIAASELTPTQGVQNTEKGE